MSERDKNSGLSKFVLWKIAKKLILLVLTQLSVFFFILFILMCAYYAIKARKEVSYQGVSSFTTFGNDVENYRNDVVTICENHGMLEYANVVLAIMQAETCGQTLDPMNAGDKLHNKKYPKVRGAIEDPLYSIEVGVLELKDLIKLTHASLEEPDKMLIVYQAYHFDRDYIDYAKSNGGYNTKNAKDYLDNSALPYYLRPSFATNVASFVFIQSGYINKFIYPVDMDDITITCSYGEPRLNGSLSKGTYFKTDGENDVLAIADGEVLGANKSMIVIQHGNYKIVYRHLKVDEDYLPDDDDDDDEPEKTEVEQGDYLGMTRDSYDCEFLLQVKNKDYYIDPMTLINLTIDKAYNSDSGNDSVRDAIVDYAKLWMSTPYVWGGTDLQRGVDCSGFMQQIYKNFGYTLPRVSYNQANFKGAVWSTTEVCPNVLQKGDLIFYSKNGRVNHVTMYIGNGLIIGAQSSKTGIKIVQYNYRTPVKAIRVIP